jgi:hypothetical protein
MMFLQKYTFKFVLNSLIPTLAKDAPKDAPPNKSALCGKRCEQCKANKYHVSERITSNRMVVEDVLIIIYQVAANRKKKLLERGGGEAPK